MELYEAKDLPSADLSHQHVDDDSKSEVNRLGVSKSKCFFFLCAFLVAVDCTFVGAGVGGGGGLHFMWQRSRVLNFNFVLSNLFLMPIRIQFLFFLKRYLKNVF